ncbi:class I SAM-dependent methyltransferase [Actinomycetospora sp. TBRC 11914]|uniref:class I SAM-dependent methyltransferase n=1 Tax=Actinomycetospora sp. TBRC 11914 TaxID=2729387 RepID=UPI00145CDD9D|nr:class I SAM-dependent methyltransferase [Actinomycetospora sp. TBRC 11914]NMO93228.1 methyltransferase domain-containing protein [Actinomycetospora sp. TBRC 11914]
MTMTERTTTFEVHPARGAFNAAFFTVMGPNLEWNLRRHKRRVFADLPGSVVELGSGVGANLPYLAPGSTLVAVEPNPPMHRRLRAAAERRGVRLDLRERVAEDTGLPDASVDAVISSLVLCTVPDPDAVLAEVRRILRPGGTYRFVEHVAARPGTPTRWLQRVLRRPWAWTFEGCSCERDLEAAVRAAGFARVDVEPYRLHTPFVPFNSQIAGVVHV